MSVSAVGVWDVRRATEIANYIVSIIRLKRGRERHLLWRSGSILTDELDGIARRLRHALAYSIPIFYMEEAAK